MREYHLGKVNLPDSESYWTGYQGVEGTLELSFDMCTYLKNYHDMKSVLLIGIEL